MKNILSGFDIDKYKELKEINGLRDDAGFVKDKDNIQSAFKKIAEKNGLPYPKQLVKSLIAESAPKILKLKNHFNRPRPKHLSASFGIKLKDVEMDSMKTPSYPSGHSVQGVVVGKALGKLYPKHKAEFEKEGKDISISRRIGKAHFKSDSDLGEKIGDDMFNYIKDKI
jgi:hypothetical protein